MFQKPVNIRNVFGFIRLDPDDHLPAVFSTKLHYFASSRFRLHPCYCRFFLLPSLAIMAIPRPRAGGDGAALSKNLTIRLLSRCCF